MQTLDYFNLETSQTIRIELLMFSLQSVLGRTVRKGKINSPLRGDRVMVRKSKDNENEEEEG